MAVSSNQNFNLDIDEVIQEAYENLGGPPITGHESSTARRSLNLLLSDWQNRGILLWTTSEISQTMTSGTASYSLASTVCGVVEAVCSRNSTEIQMDRISMEMYLKIPDKTTTGRPIHIATHRLRDNIDFYVWPTPENSTDVVKLWSVNRFYNFDKSSEDPDVPYRFLPPLSAGLSYFLSLKRPGISAQRSSMLQQHYEILLNNAMEEDRERVSLLAKPRIRIY